MKPFNHNKKWLWLGGLAVYLLMLCLLVLAERRSPDASIDGFADALWYSLVTMSTVGYGDLYPVTALGRVLGAAFVLLSLGMLTFVFSLIIRAVTGKMLPALRLFALRKRHWFLFADRNDCSTALAKKLAENHPEAVFLFPEAGTADLPEGAMVYPDAMETVARKKKDGCSLFFLGSADGDVAGAIAALETGHPVYCQTEYAPDICPEGLVLFNRYDCCAQAYWKDHGLCGEKQTVLLIGDGNYARHLLDRAILLNVFSSQQQISYHVFGNWEEYRRNHHRLGAVVGLDGAGTGDQLYFHTDSWNADPDLLATADRILICQDGVSQNLLLLRQLRQYFPTKAEIHLLLDRQIPGETVFGTNDEIYTEELMMRGGQNYAARCIHKLYSDGVPGAPRWEELSEFLRQSNIAAADHLIVKIRILLEDMQIRQVTAENCRAAYGRYQELKQTRREEFRWIEHQRWQRFHSLYNWRYGPKRDNLARIHPMMRPYEELEISEQEKDDYSWELIGQLAGKLNKDPE